MQPATASVIPAEAEAVTKPASVPQERAMRALALRCRSWISTNWVRISPAQATRLRHGDRGAEAGHRARDVDHRPQAEPAADVSFVTSASQVERHGRAGVRGLDHGGDHLGVARGRPRRSRAPACPRSRPSTKWTTASSTKPVRCGPNGGTSMSGKAALLGRVELHRPVVRAVDVGGTLAAEQLELQVLHRVVGARQDPGVLEHRHRALGVLDGGDVEVGRVDAQARSARRRARRRRPGSGWSSRIQPTMSTMWLPRNHRAEERPDHLSMSCGTATVLLSRA